MSTLFNRLKRVKNLYYHFTPQPVMTKYEAIATNTFSLVFFLFGTYFFILFVPLVWVQISKILLGSCNIILGLVPRPASIHFSDDSEAVES